MELRKLVQRFCQFLADEEQFWIGCALRFARSFVLNEAKPTIAALNFNRFADDPNRRNVFPGEGEPTSLSALVAMRGERRDWMFTACPCSV